MTFRYLAHRGWMLLAAATLAIGCDANVTFNNPIAPSPKQPSATVATSPSGAESAQPVENDKEQQAQRSMIRTTSIRGGSTKFGSGKPAAGPRPTVAENMTRLRAEIEQSVEFSPTIVVWMVDATESAAEIRGEWAKAAKQLYSNFQASGVVPNASTDALTTALVAFGESPNYLIEQPSSDFGRILTQLDDIPKVEVDREQTFQTVSDVLEKYGTLKSQQNRELLVVLISDEAGEDMSNLDGAVQKAAAVGARIHVIGLPAPMGRQLVPGVAMEMRADGQMATVLGPETRQSQRVDMKFNYGGFSSEEVDSGYGPFGLSYLARSTGGSFLMSRLPHSNWPSAALRFDDEVMRKYPPQYLSESEYQAKLQGNKALQGLHLASQQPQVDAMTYPASTFIVQDEAQLKNSLDRAQRIAARLGPTIDVIYDPLAEGEKDRDKITDPRWQASYDLALGRAAAAKARVDGYNQMLAILKGGKNFENPNSNTWYLEPADTLEEAGSRLEKMRLQAKEALQRVIDEHPDTPWAYFAQRELETPIGWKWVEQ